ncbi:MAG TPA: DUF434 domain-containing protein [Tissierellaceae bacterium]|nr:DUF434 domain-containing protein [Tissierellaceae bacterium]
MNIKRRGFDPMDYKWFGESELKKLNRAADEIQFLLDRDYKMTSASEFVANHYLLSLRQRNALKRSLSTEEQYEERMNKSLPNHFLKDDIIFIDGFNIIINLEVALSQSVLVLGRDGVIRDLAGLRGTYRIIDKTYNALEILGDFFEKKEVPGVAFYLDTPVSNSGNLKILIHQILGKYNFNVDVELVKNPDKILMDKARIVSADSVILDNCKSWFNISGEIIRDYVDDPFLVDFR